MGHAVSPRSPPKKRKIRFMIRESILVCALALPVWNKSEFLKEYKFLHHMLETVFPEQEFLIVPKAVKEQPQGWHVMPIGWRMYRIYGRERKSA